ncbi:YopX family protein [Priestia megaterium]|uniref:YopX family protein n=1 Tax=Priestia megaterium TaxID=1404 RepID=UPI001A94DA18|nr:YopX family protein [Priestia megaterium]QSX20013.1 hypothetical protein J0P05_22680 [Priestia megaterium]
MKEVKFRVWDKDLSKMHICGEDVHDSINFLDNTACYYNLQNGCGSLPDGTGTYDLMQYTGLKDKNGKEIYEGDIDSDDHNNLSVILYIKKYGAYCVVPLPLYLHEDYEEEVMYQYGYDCFFENMVPDKYLNIIGNIYENPELLEG